MKLKLIAASIVGLGMSTAAWAVDPFTIQDIRIEGLQRTEPATIFSYLPVKWAIASVMDKRKPLLKICMPPVSSMMYR